MNLAEALLEFEELRTTPEGHHVPYCCGLPVIMDSTEGVSRILCTCCQRTVVDIGRQWVIEHWGSKGIGRNPAAPV